MAESPMVENKGLLSEIEAYLLAVEHADPDAPPVPTPVLPDSTVISSEDLPRLLALRARADDLLLRTKERAAELAGSILAAEIAPDAGEYLDERA